ncbi:hypothetical protein B566_EDAN013676 [Ephemera danica]|nr:hypothetical protein B566_EDAN013676 [Ephemera danica]
MNQKKKFIIYCVYALEMETMLCLILPTLIILITNIFFFVSTARRIHAARRNLQTSDGSEHLRFKLYLKLFGIMGGSWILLFFVVIVGSFISQLHSVMEVIFTIVLKVSVLIVDLQGFWIFMKDNRFFIQHCH